jgi:hypothetical protein
VQSFFLSELHGLFPPIPIFSVASGKGGGGEIKFFGSGIIFS